MCRPATCKKCGKASWAGCGAHVDQVMAGVPTAQRCVCSSVAVAPSAAGTTSGRRWGIFRR